MRALPLLAAIAAALFLIPTASAQDAPRPSLRSTVVVPSHPGEAVRITTYARRPVERGRLARRYRGIHVNRSAPAPAPVVRAQPVARTYSTPRNTFVQRGGSFYQILPRR